MVNEMIDIESLNVGDYLVDYNVVVDEITYYANKIHVECSRYIYEDEEKVLDCTMTLAFNYDEKVEVQQ